MAAHYLEMNPNKIEMLYFPVNSCCLLQELSDHPGFNYKNFFLRNLGPSDIIRKKTSVLSEGPDSFRQPNLQNEFSITPLASHSCLH